MLKARTNHASTALNGEIYAIGGEASRPITRPLIPRARGPHPTPLWGCCWGELFAFWGQ